MNNKDKAGPGPSLIAISVPYAALLIARSAGTVAAWIIFNKAPRDFCLCRVERWHDAIRGIKGDQNPPGFNRMVHELTEGFLDDLSSCSQTRTSVKGNRKCQLADDLFVGGNDCDGAKLPCVLSIGYNTHTKHSD
ncbi:hypothetical protein NA56DRAFT_748437 [Hyaloscypha hepaticicola]|uniref:Uncharacterized protein n=1 Tax=Hyaloscypha hepaticicola TaxID=2082293 RepID=A0A2J6Q741_9HELO|nr:hypothetical protein NA56DRAFT_748437 [Hyaloscypha hepaticicola]